MVIRLRGADPFDAAFSPDPPQPLRVYVATLPSNGTLHLPRAPGLAPPPC